MFRAQTIADGKQGSSCPPSSDVSARHHLLAADRRELRREGLRGEDPLARLLHGQRLALAGGRGRLARRRFHLLDRGVGGVLGAGLGVVLRPPSTLGPPRIQKMATPTHTQSKTAR